MAMTGGVPTPTRRWNEACSGRAVTGSATNPFGAGPAGIGRTSPGARLMRVYTILPQRHWRDVATAASGAEAAGFDALMTAELGHDPLMLLALAALARRTGGADPSVVVAFPRSPTVLAQQAWDIHANSGGRFVLGIGSQVKGHNERRFGIGWTAPAPRMRDYVLALRAGGEAWKPRPAEFRQPALQADADDARFLARPTGLPMIPVTVAAVGEAMLRVAGQFADGVRLHPLCSRAYLEQVCLPQMMEGMRRGGRSRVNFDVHGGGFICTGPDEGVGGGGDGESWRRIGFYGSTRTYLPILALHGLEELGARLHRMSVDGTGPDGGRGVRRCRADLCRLRHLRCAGPPLSRNVSAAWRTPSICIFRAARRPA